MQLLFLSWTEIAIIVLVVLLLFGGKKIPELMKGMGQGVKSFKDGMNGNATDDKSQRDTNGTLPDGKPAASDNKPAANQNMQSEDKASSDHTASDKGNESSPRL